MCTHKHDSTNDRLDEIWLDLTRQGNPGSDSKHQTEAFSTATLATVLHVCPLWVTLQAGLRAEQPGTVMALVWTEISFLEKAQNW